MAALAARKRLQEAPCGWLVGWLVGPQVFVAQQGSQDKCCLSDQQTGFGGEFMIVTLKM